MGSSGIARPGLVVVLALLVTTPILLRLAPGADTGAPASVGVPEAPGAEAAGSGTDQGLITTVERIVDGDTLYVADLEERVRLIGIDTPETRHPQKGVECFGREASAHLAALTPPGTRVRVEWDVQSRDRYGRPLGYLHRVDDDLFVNLRMVADGYASVSTVPPNVRHEPAFVEAQRRARDAGRGLWSQCGSGQSR